MKYRRQTAYPKFLLMLKWVFTVIMAWMVWNDPGLRLSAQPGLEEEDYATKVTNKAVFHQRIRWIGTKPPPETESRVLWNVLLQIDRRGAFDGVRLIDTQFIERFPDSAWTPSLQVNLAQYYRERGLYSKALEYWEEAWPQLRDLTTPEGRKVRNFALSHWVNFLSSLGRVEKLESLFEENGQDPLDGGPFYQLYVRAIESAQRMVREPGIAFRCGNFALANVSQKLGLEEATVTAIKHLKSPATGFALGELTRLAGHYGLDLIPVRRKFDNALVAPSVVHWKTDHYAALLEIEGDRCYVEDPTFGGARWLPTEYVNREASGNFLIPGDKVNSLWERLPATAADQIFGRGFPSAYDDSDDGVCPDDSNPDLEVSDPNSPINDHDPNQGDTCNECHNTGMGGSSGGGCSSCGASMAGLTAAGMPVWNVSEPFTTLWITDTPVYYTKSYGKITAFTLYYKQRNTRSTDFAFNFGPLWESNLLNYLDEEGSPVTTVMVYSGGANRQYTVDGQTAQFYTGATIDYDSGQDEYVMEYHEGAQLVYADKFTYGLAYPRYFLSERIDRYGRTTTYSYTTNNYTMLLSSITDHDNEVTTFDYGTGSNSDKIVKINAPHSRTAEFTYDVNERLDSITDAESMTSSFDYDGNGFITTMTTPYGDTDFELAADLSVSNTSNVVNRAVFVTHPNNSEELFMYRNNSEYLNSTSSQLLIEDQVTPPNVPNHDFDGVDFGLLSAMNSFHWGRRHYSALNSTFKSSRDFDDLTAADYTLSHSKHWLKTDEPGSLSSVISLERLPNPDGAVSPPNTSTPIETGQYIWYDYEGHYFDGVYTYTWVVGTFPQPRHVAMKLSNGDVQYTKYERNSDGQVIKKTESYTNENGTLTTRVFSYVYNGNGHLLERRFDPSGTNELLEEWEYTDTNNPSKVTDYMDLAGDWTEYTYNASTGLLTERELPTGLVSQYSYTSGQLTGITDKNASAATMRTESFSYSNGQLNSYTDPLGYDRDYTYDDLDRLTRVDHPDSSYELFTFEDLDLKKYRDRVGLTTTNYFDNMRQLTQVSTPKGNSTYYSYCGCGALESVTNPLNKTTSFDYDYNGRLTTVTQDNGDELNYYYHLDGRLDYVDDDKDTYSEWEYTYNNQGLVEQVSSASGNILQAKYNHLDHPVEVTRANGVTIDQSFDNAGRLEQRDYPDGGQQKLVWNAKGPHQYIFKETASISHTNSFQFDELKRLTLLTNANNEEIEYTYDEAGNLETLTDGKNQTTTWVYDTEGRVTTKKDQNGIIIKTFAWDDNHRMINRWTKEMGYTYFSYDNNNNLTNINYPAGTTDVDYSYDAADRLTQMTDALGTTTFGYTDNGQLSYEDQPWSSDRVTYTYTLGYRTKLALQQPSASDWEIDYDYDDDRRLDWIDADSGTFEYDFVSASLDVDKLTLPGGQYIDYAYNSAGRMDESILKTSGGTAIHSHTYNLNHAGWKTRHTLPDSSTVDYDYDSIGQLIDADASGSGVDFEYTYDDAWNLDDRVVNSTTENFYVNSENELTSSPLGTASYDDNGNMTDDGQVDYEYDAEDQLVFRGPIDLGSLYTVEINYTYDGLGRLRKKVSDYYYNGSHYDTAETRYIYDGFQVIEERDSSNSPTAHYVRGLDLSGSLGGAGGIGGLLSREWSSNTGYYHADVQGNITAMINSSGTVNADYHYDSFGNTLSQSGSWAAVNPYRFSSKMIDYTGATGQGIYYYGQRFYHPDLQRWINRDPLGEVGGINLYGFVANTPLNAVDPNGEWVFLVGLGIGVVTDWAYDKFVHPHVQEYVQENFDCPTQQNLATIGRTIDIGRSLKNPVKAFKNLKNLNRVGAAARGGRLGNQATRQHVADVATEMESRGWTITYGGGTRGGMRLPEEYLPGPGGGRLGSSFPDITATKNGRTLRVNTIDTRANGIAPTTREAANAVRIRSQTPGDHLLLVPKP